MSYKRITLNTGFLYLKSLICMFLTLFSSRWVLNGLGEDDYGLFNVVGAIIVFITFLNGVFASSASRFFAYYIHDRDEVNNWFNASVSIHGLLSAVLVIIGGIAGELCVRYFLTIPPDRVHACLIVFRCSLVAAFFSMNAIPFTAMYIATQKMVVQAFFNIFNTVLVFSFAFTLEFYSADRLCYYAVYMSGITIFVSVLEIAVAIRLFPECRLHFKKMFQRAKMVKLTSFAGWQLFGNFGYVLRNQGTAILVNKYFDPGVNSAYGIANQVSAQSMTISSSLTTAFAPAITTTCGDRNKQEFEKIAFASCLYGTFLAMFFSIPLCMEIEYVLELWLKKPPLFTGGLCVLVIVAFLIDKMTSGIGSALLANGKIAVFQVVDGVLLSLSVPAIWIMFACGFSPLALGYAFVGMRLSCMISRLIFARQILGWEISAWFKSVVLPLIQVVSVNLAYLIAIRFVMETGFPRLVISSIGSGIISLIMGYCFVLSPDNRKYIKSFLVRKFLND